MQTDIKVRHYMGIDREAVMPESNKGDGPSAVWAKLIIFSAVPILASKFLHATYVELGLSFVAASFLQALIPPRKIGFVPILTVSVAFTLLALLVQWQYHVR